MAAPAASPDDDLSAFGKSSLRPQLDLQPPQVPENSDGDVDRAVADLLAAAFDGDIPRARKSAKKLVKAGKGVDEAVAAVGDPESKRHGPLHLAAAAGKVEMCKLLIKDFHANVDATDVQGATPLVFAVQGTGSTDVVSLLLSHGADANMGDTGGIVPLHIAAERGFYEVAELLLSDGAEVDPICENSGAPIHIAAKHGHAEVLELLLQNEADSDRFSPTFNTPLVVSLFGSSVECLEILIEAGADVNAGSPVTPLTVAADKGLTDCIKFLLEADADANIPDENGKMPVEIAALKGQEECVELLFPATTPLPEYADWSIDGIIQHGKTVRLRQAYKIKAEGDAAFRKKDYQLASSRYTLALDMDPDDSTMYAKRSLCFQHMNDKESALADANAYRDMQLDLPDSGDEEEVAPLKLVEEYCKGIEALMSGLNLGPESGPADKGSSTKAAPGPPLRRSTRARKPNAYYSGPEWAS
ncbi:unnamed protein product [Urochloa decumbens]|uniref:Serine/threonine-protein kinase BSK1-like TPR repeats domain-containing protein n=1 Tax=Urochloa decumbens TaxID=240449 RepID=A0ABC8WIN3_9POAL